MQHGRSKGTITFKKRLAFPVIQTDTPNLIFSNQNLVHMGNKQNEQITDVIQRRNDLLEKLIKDCEVPVRIIGDPEKPVFIYNETAILSMYVSNFDIHFLLTPDGADVARVKLRKNHSLDHDKFMDIIKKAQHKAVIKIRCNLVSDCCIIGYNYMNKVAGEGRYPVFARHGHKVYFSKKYADQLVEELRAESYDVDPWIPAFEKDQELNIVLYES